MFAVTTDPSIDLYQVIGTVLGTALLVLGQRAWVLLQRHIGVKTAENLDHLLPYVVNSTEELSRNLGKNGAVADSDEKLDFAKKELISVAGIGGIKLSDKQAEVMIHGTLHMLRPTVEEPDMEVPYERPAQSAIATVMPAPPREEFEKA